MGAIKAKDEARKIGTWRLVINWNSRVPIPAVNNAQDFGHWEFLEIQDIHETQNLIRLGIKNGFNSLIESK